MFLDSWVLDWFIYLNAATLVLAIVMAVIKEVK